MTTSPTTSTAPSAGPTATKTFSELGVDARICAALGEANITNPFPIQELTLPLALSGADLIGQARTGTGKTLAFGIPMLQRAVPGRAGLQVLVIVPTRELCLQVAEDLIRAGVNLDLSVVACYGGKAIDVQIAALRAGADIVVGTPGRLLDLRNRGELDLSTVTGLVLDEADEMLDLGFLPDVEQLVTATAEGRQTLLFSATMPGAVVSLARRYMRKPTFLRAEVEEVRIAPETEQHFFSCHRMDKPAILARILQTPKRGLCVVFSRTKRMADTLAEELRERGIDAAPIHSDLRQDARERALRRFRDGKTTVLVATEVAARGLDIDDVTHVVNYDCPDDEKMYLHRIGRTGRAGAAGVAITLAVWNELARAEMIKRQLDIDVPTHEVFSTSPILDELFDLPARTTKQPRVTARGQRRAPASQGASAERAGITGPREVSSEPVAPEVAQRMAPEMAPEVAATAEAAPVEADVADGATESQDDARSEGKRGRRRSRSRSRSGGARTETNAEVAADEEAAAPPAAGSPSAAGTEVAAAAQTEATTRRRRRVRRRDREDGAQVIPQPDALAATVVVEPAAEAGVREPETQAATTQVTTDAAATEATTTGTALTEEATRRTRVRRRVRQDERDQVLAPSPSAGGRAPRGSARGAGRPEQQPEEARGDDSRTIDADSTDAGGTKADSMKNGAKSQDRPAAREEGGGRARRSGGSRGSGSRSSRDRRSSRGASKGTVAPQGGRGKSPARAVGAGRSSSDQGAGNRTNGTAAAAAKLDTEQLRGNGKPRLDRPMVVTHLP